MKYFLTTMVLMALIAGSPFMASAKPPPNVGPLTIAGGAVNPNDFRVTVFATGVDYPYGMVLLDDGSLLVASSHPNNKPTLFASTGELLRFVDENGDGVADGPGTVLFADLPGVVTGLATIDDLVFVNSSGYDSPGISVLRKVFIEGTNIVIALSLQGSINFEFPTGWEHRSYGLAVRTSPITASYDYELFFNLGSDTNGTDSVRTVPFSGLISSGARELEEAALYSVGINDNPDTVEVGLPTLIARGLRNAAAFGFHPITGDLYITDNGIDNRDTEEPLSVDELNVIFSDEIGGLLVEDFGFAGNYVEYGSDTVIGNPAGNIPPMVTFQPSGELEMESEGPAGMAFAPSGFPEGLNDGIFVGFHGKSSAGSSNEENPMVYVDLSFTPPQYFHFVANTSPDVGHLNGLLATEDSLFAADLSSVGSVDNGAGSGVIYQIHALGDPIILTELHLLYLDGSSEPSGRGGKWDATVTITVHDSDDWAVSDATVIGSWSSGASGTGSCITDVDGECSITKNSINRNSPSVTFMVTSVTKSDSTYISYNNHVSDEIVIQKNP